MTEYEAGGLSRALATSLTFLAPLQIDMQWRPKLDLAATAQACLLPTHAQVDA
jgi:hypothetical protein